MKAGTICMFTIEVIVSDSRKLLSKYLGKKKEGREGRRDKRKVLGRKERRKERRKVGRQERRKRMLLIYGNRMALFQDSFQPNF